MANPIVTVIAIAGVVSTGGVAVAVNTDLTNQQTAETATADQTPVIVHIPAEPLPPVVITREVPATNLTPQTSTKTVQPEAVAATVTAPNAQTAPAPAQPAPAPHATTGGSGVAYEDDDETEDREEEEETEEVEEEEEND